MRNFGRVWKGLEDAGLSDPFLRSHAERGNERLFFYQSVNRKMKDADKGHEKIGGGSRYEN